MNPDEISPNWSKNAKKYTLIIIGIGLIYGFLFWIAI